MSETSKEWDMVQELYELIDELSTPAQQEFVKELFDNLDPYLPFLEQKSEDAETWLYTLHDFYVNGNEDAFQETYEE